MNNWMALLGAMSVGTLAAVAAPLNIGHVPAQAKFLVHVDAETLRTSTLGTFMVEQMAEGKAKVMLDAFSAMVGFDPRTDLHGITMYGSSQRPEDGVVLLHGNFPAAKLDVLVRAKESYEAVEHESKIVHSWEDDERGRKVRRFGVITPNGIMAISEGLPSIRNFVDVQEGRAAVLAPHALPLPEAGQLPMVTISFDLDAVENLGANAAILGKLRNGLVQVSEVNGSMVSTMRVRTENEATAQQLHSMAQGMLAFAQLNGGSKPELAELLSSVRISLRGSEIEGSASFSVKSMLDRIKVEMEKKNL
jgi:hypothetical protein